MSGEYGEAAILSGTPASAGVAFGRVFLYTEQRFTREAGTPAEEARSFAEAVETAHRELGRLVDQSDSLASEIIEFQSMLLEDDELLDPVRARIERGETADLAWTAILDSEIADYRDTENEYMKARASDLVDLKDRVLRVLASGNGALAATPDAGSIVLADDLNPSAFLEWDWSTLRGLALRRGSATSHVAILARARGIPMIVGLGKTSGVNVGDSVVVDGEEGTLERGDNELLRKIYRTRAAAVRALERKAESVLREQAYTRSGKRIRVFINVDDPAILEGVDPDICDGIGLTRTEFLFRSNDLPSEDDQFAIYRKIVKWADGRPTVIRALDAGGDKPIPGITYRHESNPFLGMRGIRILLTNRRVFRAQLRALARAASLGHVKVMLPMVTTPREFVESKDLLCESISQLKQEGVACAMPEMGIMVETPAAALTAVDWPVDFYSIGSNDLIQYVTASSRDNPKLEELADPLNPGVLELIERTIDAGRERGAEVSLCGDMASTPDHIPRLLALGLDTLSVAIAQVGQVKLAIQDTS